MFVWKPFNLSKPTPNTPFIYLDIFEKSFHFDNVYVCISVILSYKLFVRFELKQQGMLPVKNK